MPKRKHDQEEDYFARIDREKKEALKALMDAKETAETEAALKALHFHKCGKCGNSMNAKLFHGVEIEVCVKCGSVLLDPGELEELAGTEKNAWGNVASFFFPKK